MKSFYDVLGVSKFASDVQIKKAYILRSKMIDPDRFNQTNQKDEWVIANEMLKEINLAYEVLDNPIRRSEYDQVMRAEYSLLATPPPQNRTSSSPPPDQTITPQQILIHDRFCVNLIRHQLDRVMSFILLSRHVRTYWFHRLYRVLSYSLITYGVCFFIYGIILVSESGNKKEITLNEKNNSELSSNIKTDPVIAEMDRLVADAEKILAVTPIECGGKWKNQHIVDYERSIAFNYMFIAFIPWISLWLSYRVVLYILMGKKSFVD
jgi:hypothetical protein